MDYSEVIRRIDGLRERIIAHGPMSDEVRKKVHYKFRLDWNYFSNSMEGNTLTPDETRSVMVGNLTVGGKPLKDVLEMKGHDEVVSTILSIGKGDVRLSEARIMEIHRAIMHEDDPEKRRKIGIWKPEANYMINYKGERFDFVAPDEVPDRMHDLLNRTNAAIDGIVGGKKKAPHPVDVALRFHLDYVAIHPFYDGNGRTARILTNLLLISCGYPPFWVKTDEREAYGRYLGDIQAYGGNPDLFLAFAGKLILRSQQLMLDAIEGREIILSEDLEKRVSLLKSKFAFEPKTSESVKRSKTLVQTLLGEDLKKLVEVVEQTVLPLASFFIESSVEFVSGGHFLYRGSLDSPSIGDPLQFEVRFVYRGFKADAKLNDMKVDFRFKLVFDEFTYSISVPYSKTQMRRYYHERLSAVEIDKIALDTANFFAEMIESRVERTKRRK
jgi:Fic family protein